MREVFSISERLACRLVGIARSAYRRPLPRQTVADPDKDLRAWLRAWAADNPRRGYRMAWADLRAEGKVINKKKVWRLWREEGLKVPQRRCRKRAGTSTLKPFKPYAANQVWAVDFQFTADEQGRAIKICSIIDEYTRECVGNLVERSITAEKLREHLDIVCLQRETYPQVLRSDNGSEFTSQTMATWASEHTGLVFIPPGQPWKNGYVESFNSRIRDECLNLHSFYNLVHAQTIIGDWKHHYNTRRRHSALGYKTPAEYAAA